MTACLTQVDDPMPFEREIKGMTYLTSKPSNSVARRFVARLLLALLVTAVLVPLSMCASAQAAAPAFGLKTDIPDTALPGQGFKAFMDVENSGTAPMSGPVTLSLELSDGLRVLNGFEKIETSPTTGEFRIGEIEQPANGSCELVDQTVTC